MQFNSWLIDARNFAFTESALASSVVRLSRHARGMRWFQFQSQRIERRREFRHRRFEQLQRLQQLIVVSQFEQLFFIEQFQWIIERLGVI